MCFVTKFQAKIIIMDHIENARENEILMWAVGVKIKGNSAMKFRMKMNKKITLMKRITPLGALVISAFISLLILLSEKYFLLKKYLNFRINNMGKKMVIHTEFNNDEDGSKIEKRFIINFKIILRD
jgi:hypothetical protein